MADRIVIVAFHDKRKKAVAYREFETTEEAVRFYAKKLAEPDVAVISTRKVRHGK